MLILLLVGCGEKPGPEAIADEFVASCIQAAESRRPSELRRLISTEYRDEYGRSAADVTAIAAGYLLRNRSVHVFTRLQQAIERDGRIEATVLAALAGRPINDASLLPTIDADMYWFELTLHEQDGDWRLLEVRWRQALVEDFF